MNLSKPDEGITLEDYREQLHQADIYIDCIYGELEYLGWIQAARDHYARTAKKARERGDDGMEAMLDSLSMSPLALIEAACSLKAQAKLEQETDTAVSEQGANDDR